MPSDTWAIPRLIRSPNPVRNGHPIAAGSGVYGWLTVVATVLAGSVPLTLLLPTMEAPAATLVSWSGVALLVSVILGNSVRLRQRPLAPLQVAAQAAASSLLLLTALTWFRQTQATPASMLRLALATAMLAWLVSALVQLFSGHANRQACAGRILLIFALLGLAPLWGGMSMDVLAPSESGAADILIGISPTTYLAQAVEWDYLRSDWFYRATPLGTLRFEYPDFWLSTVFLGFLALAVQGLGAARWRLRPPRSESPFNTSTI